MALRVCISMQDQKSQRKQKVEHTRSDTSKLQDLEARQWRRVDHC